MKKIPFKISSMIVAVLRRSKRLLLICHRNPDGDALGATLALYSVLRLQLKREVILLCNDVVPENFRFLPYFFEFRTKLDPHKDRFDTVVFLDTADRKQIGLEKFLPIIFNKKINRINIDHHHDNSCFGDINLVVDSSSTSEVIFRLLKNFGWEITSQIATCLLTGIYTDTGSFQHDNATRETFQIASELILKGARLNLIIRNTFQYKPLSRLRLWGRALRRIRRDQKEGINVSVITKKDLEEVGATLDDLEGVVSVINTIPNTKATILLSEKNNRDEIKGSIRTEMDDVDVSQIASLFGGGGHKKASGFSLPGRLERTGRGGWKIVK